MKIKSVIKTIVPTHIWDTLHDMRVVSSYKKDRDVYMKIQRHYNIVISRLKEKKQLTVFFIGTFSSTWKYDSLYRLMECDPLFKPVVIIGPVVNRGFLHMLEHIHELQEFCKLQKYEYINVYDEHTDTYLDVASLKPDLVFFTNQYKGLIHENCYVDRFYDCLTFFVGYGFCSIKYPWAVATNLQNSVWRYFADCKDNANQIQKYSPTDGYNVYVSGYPLYDSFRASNGDLNVWRHKNSHLKRVIWAPHHTIDGQDKMIKFSTFLLLADKMFMLAEEYRGKIQFAFKPHPLLKDALYKHPDWGQIRTDEYYARWANGDNSVFLDGDYVNLFVSSDAMIHDCGSFTIEYLFVNKPVMYLTNYDRNSQSNKVGIRALGCHYKGTTIEDIRDFLDNVVLQEKDSLRSKRDKYIRDVLLPPNGCTVAENMLNEIKKEIGK